MRGEVKPVPGETLVLGVIGADVHAIGNRILDYALREAGFNTVNLGVLVSQEEFIKAALETGAKAILVGSLYGHAELDCQGFREKTVEAGIGDILLYIGGYLVVGKCEWATVEERFRALGFDRVYPPGTLPEQAIADLRTDLDPRKAPESE